MKNNTSTRTILMLPPPNYWREDIRRGQKCDGDAPPKTILSNRRQRGEFMKSISEQKEGPAAYAFIAKIVFWAVALAVIAKLVTCVGSRGVSAEFEKEFAIYDACRSGLEGILHDPASSQFNPLAASAVLDEGGGTYSVYIPLRAKNGFGALRKARGKCIVTWSGKPSLLRAEILQ